MLPQFRPPDLSGGHRLIAPPGQYLFSVTTMTMAAVVSTYVLGLLYFAAAGVHFFYG